ncbi:DUF5615 family PIN-like protein [Sphingobium sp.]|uniref:DUF5615 family PIN-like protein n=1 Tax=Sphingobium sp. TaxID=1912891 RepID=UPI002601C08F|nr:DUF5615 family PIN-like protein [Sphingobium sp.]
MKFLVDAQLPPALCRWLCDRGHEAEHVSDIGMIAANDVAISARAEADGAVLVSEDADIGVIRGETYSVDKHPLDGTEEENFRLRYCSILREWRSHFR